MSADVLHELVAVVVVVEFINPFLPLCKSNHELKKLPPPFSSPSNFQEKKILKLERNSQSGHSSSPSLLVKKQPLFVSSPHVEMNRKDEVRTDGDKHADTKDDNFPLAHNGQSPFSSP